MLNVGLTGGIACGKSTVARMLVEKGAILIDFDELGPCRRRTGRAGVEGDRLPFRRRRSSFRTGRIDRRKLGDIVFADREKRELLNRLVHPAIFESGTEKLKRSGRSAGRHRPFRHSPAHRGRHEADGRCGPARLHPSGGTDREADGAQRLLPGKRRKEGSLRRCRSERSSRLPISSSATTVRRRRREKR